MKCQILFSEKNKKNITNLSSAELAQKVVTLNNCQSQTVAADIPKYMYYFFCGKIRLNISHDDDDNDGLVFTSLSTVL